MSELLKRAAWIAYLWWTAPYRRLRIAKLEAELARADRDERFERAQALIATAHEKIDWLEDGLFSRRDRRGFPAPAAWPVGGSNHVQIMRNPYPALAARGMLRSGAAAHINGGATDASR